MMYPVTITQKWQMTIPQEVRKKLGISSRGKALVKIIPHSRSIQIQSFPRLLSLGGVFKPKKTDSAIKIRRTLEQVYERS